MVGVTSIEDLHSYFVLEYLSVYWCVFGCVPLGSFSSAACQVIGCKERKLMTQFYRAGRKP